MNGSRLNRAAAVFLSVLSGCSPQGFFYYPNRILYTDPDQMGVRCRIVEYPSLNNRKLYGLYFPAAGTPRGTVVHFHGNFGNVSNHFPMALFLVRHGFDVLSFDYEGYGASEGRPSPQATVSDGIASVRYAQAHLRNPSGAVFVFGQSLGAAVGIVVTAQEPLVKAAVFEAPFATYRSQGWNALRRHWFSWPLVILVPFLNRKEDPILYIGRISPRPILLIHGTEDAIVSVKMSERLYAAAREPKTLWEVPGAGHLQCHRFAPMKYEDRIVNLFDSALRADRHSPPVAAEDGK